MAKRITVLPQPLINKIAAGEVVERPASVVKELVENAIDAGATQIEVEVRAAGKSFIRVADNGCGMDKEDLLLAIERYATSKITTEEDLFNIHTLGFRGEALPSIAAVSSMRITSSLPESHYGTTLLVEGGRVVEVKETAPVGGTIVEVKNLFYNTPARRKFLKSDLTEFNHTLNTVIRYTLIYPCGFKFCRGKEVILDIFPHQEVREKLRQIFGEELYKNLLEVKVEKEGIKVEGYITNQTYLHSNRSKQYLFVNKRPVQNINLTYAVLDGYATLIPERKYPAVFLNIEVSPEVIDVNVHPTKREVKFSNERLVKDIIEYAVRVSLTGAGMNASETKRREFASGNQIESMDEIKRKDVGQDRGMGMAYGKFSSFQQEYQEFFTSDAENMKLIQVNNAYIIYETPEGFLIIDQHAAHERVLYEKLKKEFDKGKVISQGLLIPENMEFGLEEYRIVLENAELFNQIGFSIKDFGMRTILVEEIPAQMKNDDIKGVLQEIVSIISLEKNISRVLLIEKALRIMACRGAVKQGDKLDLYEMKRLVSEWLSIENRIACPHGRPAAIEMKKEELDKQFHRT